jgi:hypothetical protein
VISHSCILYYLFFDIRIDRFAFDTYVQLEIFDLMKTNFDCQNVIISSYGLNKIHKLVEISEENPIANVMQSRTRAEIAVFDSSGLEYHWCNYTTRSLYQNYI